MTAFILIVSTLAMVRLDSGVPTPAAPPKLTAAVALAVLMVKASAPSIVDMKLMLLAPVNPVVSTVMAPVAKVTRLLKVIVAGPVPVALRVPLSVVAPFVLV